MKLLSRIKKSQAIIWVLLISAALRLYKINNLPVSLFGDEIDVGYHAWSLITTGRDYMGNLLPTYIQSLTEWRTPLLSYVISPFVGILGPTTTALRLPVALLGILNIYLIYLFTNQLFPQPKTASKNTKIDWYNQPAGLLAALILGLSPWHIHYSRMALDSTLLISLSLAGALFFLRQRYFLSALSFILTFYAYPTANLFTPLIVLSLFIIYRRTKNKPKFPNAYTAQNYNYLARALFLFILILPIGYHLTLGQAAGRFKQISIFKDPELVYDIISQRTAVWVDQNSTKEIIFHNKAISYLAKAGSNYLSAFSPQFLFLSGDPNFRHSIGKFGELLWVTAPFLALGSLYLFKTISKKKSQLIAAWILLAPIPSALTTDGAMHATRLILLLPPLAIASALGVRQSVLWIKDHKQSLLLPFVFLAIALTAANIAAYWHRYTAHYKFESARNWQYGYQQIFTKLTPLLGTANRVFINNTYEPSLLKFAFFTQYPPSEFQKNFVTDIQTENIIKDFSGFKFADKYYFGQAKKLDKLLGFLRPGDIYLAVQLEEVDGTWDWAKDPPVGLQVLDSTKDLLNQPLFYLVTKSPVELQ